jgi:hypothetical protein
MQDNDRSTASWVCHFNPWPSCPIADILIYASASAIGVRYGQVAGAEAQESGKQVPMMTCIQLSCPLAVLRMAGGL